MGKMKSYWMPTGNRKRKFMGNTRHWKSTCPFCMKGYKNVVLHMKINHPGKVEEFQETLKKSLLKGEFGVVSGVRFINTK